MPPRSKFTREEIIKAALEIVRTEGIDRVTSRNLGTKLNSTARPIFTVFKNMEDVLTEVKKAAKNIYNEYIREGLKEEIQFKGVGKAYIKFAISEPKLFQLLFMSETDQNTTIAALPVVDDNFDDILSSIIQQYGVSKEVALSVYSHLWIYTHGIATLSATRTVKFSGEEISEMITEVFRSLLIKKINETGERNKTDDKG